MDQHSHQVLGKDRDELAALFEPARKAELKDFLALLHPADVAELVQLVDRAHWPELIRRLSDEQVSELMEELPDELQPAFTELISLPRLADIVEEMDSDDAADLLAELPESRAEAILGEMPAAEAEELQQLLTYPEDSAGGIMQTELAAQPASRTVAQAVDALRELTQEVEEIHQIYVTDDAGRYVGQLPAVRLLLARPQQLLGEIMEEPIASVPPEVDQEQVARLFRKYDLVSMAVVDRDGKLLGRILIDDIVDVLDEEASEDMLRFAGTSPDDLTLGTRLITLAAKRLPWLLIYMVGGVVGGQLLKLFKLVSGDPLILVSFAPVIVGMAGSVSTQSATVIIRGFALGRINFKNLLRHLLRELGIGVVIGLACGLVVGLLAFALQASPQLGLVVGLSMTLAGMFATGVGVAAPSFFKSVGIDPAIASGPIVTTLADMGGVLLYFGVAAALFKLLGL